MSFVAGLWCLVGVLCCLCVFVILCGAWVFLVSVLGLVVCIFVCDLRSHCLFGVVDFVFLGVVVVMGVFFLWLFFMFNLWFWVVVVLLVLLFHLCCESFGVWVCSLRLAMWTWFVVIVCCCWFWLFRLSRCVCGVVLGVGGLFVGWWVGVLVFVRGFL